MYNTKQYFYDYVLFLYFLLPFCYLVNNYLKMFYHNLRQI